MLYHLLQLVKRRFRTLQLQRSEALLLPLVLYPRLQSAKRRFRTLQLQPLEALLLLLLLLLRSYHRLQSAKRRFRNLQLRLPGALLLLLGSPLRLHPKVHLSRIILLRLHRKQAQAPRAPRVLYLYLQLRADHFRIPKRQHSPVPRSIVRPALLCHQRRLTTPRSRTALHLRFKALGPLNQGPASLLYQVAMLHSRVAQRQHFKVLKLRHPPGLHRRVTRRPQQLQPRM